MGEKEREREGQREDYLSVIHNLHILQLAKPTKDLPQVSFLSVQTQTKNPQTPCWLWVIL